jgi:hypothetical protein
MRKQSSVTLPKCNKSIVKNPNDSEMYENSSKELKNMIIRVINVDLAWWCIPTIQVNQNGEIRGITAQGQPEQKVSKTPSQPRSQMW